MCTSMASTVPMAAPMAVPSITWSDCPEKSESAEQREARIVLRTDPADDDPFLEGRLA